MLLTFDIGGTRVRAARSPAAGLVEPIGEWPTPGADFAAFAGLIADVAAAAGGSAVALSLAGVVDPATGRARVANIPCIDGRSLAADLARALGLPVTIANDADCFALAEAMSGAGRGHPVVFGVILGTGAGGGLVIDGRIHHGAGGFAGEWGHGPVLRTRVPGEAVEIPHWRCGCGLWGCADTLATGPGLTRLDAHLGGGGRAPAQLLADWAAGQAAALRTVAVWLDLVSAPLAMIVNLIGPSAVPVGGGLSNDRALVAALDRSVRARILRSTDDALLVPAVHRVEPGLIGASHLHYGARDG